MTDLSLLTYRTERDYTYTVIRNRNARPIIAYRSSQYGIRASLSVRTSHVRRETRDSREGPGARETRAPRARRASWREARRVTA